MKFIYILLLVMASTVAKANDVYIHLIGWHPTTQHYTASITCFADKNVCIKDRRKLNQSNFGIGYAIDLTANYRMEIGTYHNSIYQQSYYTQIKQHLYTIKNINFGLNYGIVIGYFKPILPAIIGNIEYGNVAVNIIPDPVIPAIGFGYKF